MNLFKYIRIYISEYYIRRQSDKDNIFSEGTIMIIYQIIEKFWEELIAYFPLRRHEEIGGHPNAPLPINDVKWAHRHTDTQTTQRSNNSQKWGTDKNTRDSSVIS
jgi:hypothetical protein